MYDLLCPTLGVQMKTDCVDLILLSIVQRRECRKSQGKNRAGVGGTRSALVTLGFSRALACTV